MYQRFFKQSPKSGFFEVERSIEGSQPCEEAEETRWGKLERAIDIGISIVEDV